ncbi:MAG: EamA family transporter [Ardenticatenaceae bacterium]|nr:EamA family transporter [Ardenticatenaceae bacterium]
MKPIHYGALSMLGMAWGASFLFINVAAPDFGPFLLMFLRVAVAGLVMLGMAMLKKRPSTIRQTLQLRQKWHNYLIVGLLNCALPFPLVAYAELKVTASLAAILISTMPLFTAVIAAVWGSEQLNGRKLWGMLLGIMGVVVLVGSGPLALRLDVIVAIFALLLASFSYAAATVYAKKHLSHLPSALAASVQMLSAALLLLLPAIGSVPAERPSLTAIINLSALILLSTILAYLLYFFLLREVGSTRTASVTFLIPLFATILAIVFLHEPFDISLFLGMAIILASIRLVNGKQTSEQAILDPRCYETAEKVI